MGTAASYGRGAMGTTATMVTAVTGASSEKADLRVQIWPQVEERSGHTMAEIWLPPRLRHGPCLDPHWEEKKQRRRGEKKQQ
jgi:hypothetical protein